MPEIDITVTFTIPEDRLEEVSYALERANPETEEGALRTYSVLGPRAIELIKQTDEDGERPWVDEDLTVEEQLIPQEFWVEGRTATVQYMCGDEDTAAELSRFMKELYEAAGFEKVSVSAESEWTG